MNDDLISRADAVDEITAYKLENVLPDELESKGFNDGIDLAITLVSMLPSTQKEQNNDADFWHKRSDEYYRIAMNCISEMQKGTKLTDIAINENGIVFKKERQWIPVTERLPEDGRQVLVYARGVHYSLAKYDEMRDADGVYRKQWVTFDAWKPFYTIKEVIAWCELPQYEGRQDDKY